MSFRTICAYVTPRASRDMLIAGTLPNGAEGYRAWVRSLPEKGKANEHVLRLLARELGVPKSRLEIVRGSRARLKIVRCRVFGPE